MSLTRHPYAIGKVAGGNHSAAQNDEREPDELTQDEVDALARALNAEKIQAADERAVRLQHRDDYAMRPADREQR